MKKTKIEIKKGDIVKWQGIRNSDTGNIENGYLWFATIDGGSERTGKMIKGKNRSEAIKNWKLEVVDSSIDNTKIKE